MIFSNKTHNILWDNRLACDHTSQKKRS